MVGRRSRRSRVERIGRPIVIGVLVVLLAAASGLAYLRLRDDRIALGDKGPVTAVTDTSCRSIRIEHDGLALQGSGRDVRAQWRGREVEGTLVLDEHGSEDGVEGTFRADDGTTVEVHGGREGEYFFTLGCAIWGS